MNTWVVCCLFNFTGSKFRLYNYNAFRRQLKKHKVKILTVEFSPKEEYELNYNDADILIQLSDGDLMWQKERLLNIGIDRLPTDTDNVIIIDTDVIFGQRDIIQRIEKKLKKYQVVQCFEYKRDLNPLLDLTKFDFFNVDQSLSQNFYDNSAYKQDSEKASIIRNFQRCGQFNGIFGYAWAFNYKIIKKIKLFEDNIVGGGDRTMAAAFLRQDLLYHFPGTNKQPFEDYCKLVKKNIKRKEVGYLKDTTIYVLYHGEIKKRYYNERHNILKMYEFDAAKDLIKQKKLPLKFNDSVDEAMKESIKYYFVNRRENLPLPEKYY
jgi:hypothetical protein